MVKIMKIKNENTIWKPFRIRHIANATKNAHDSCGIAKVLVIWYESDTAPSVVLWYRWDIWQDEMVPPNIQSDVFSSESDGNVKLQGCDIRRHGGTLFLSIRRSFRWTAELTLNNQLLNGSFMYLSSITQFLSPQFLSLSFVSKSCHWKSLSDKWESQ